MILDSSYFVGELLIAGIAGTSPAQLSMKAELDWFIAVYEKKYLRLLLGDAFYEAFIADQEEETPVYGTLKEMIYDENFLLSPVAGYVYYWYMRNSNTQTTALNQVRSVPENGAAYNNFDKMVKAWNLMVDLSTEIWDHLCDNPVDYLLFDSSRTFPFEKINTWNI